MVAARVSGLSPAKFLVRFSRASGHSQGLVTTVAVFSSKDHASFFEDVQKALRWFLFASIPGQQLCLILALEPLSFRVPFVEMECPEPHVKLPDSYILYIVVTERY